MGKLYEQIYDQSIQHPDTFWQQAADDVHWDIKTQKPYWTPPTVHSTAGSAMGD